MAPGDIARPDDVVVARLVDAPPDEIVDHLTEFAVRNGLRLDRRHDGDGMRFVRAPEMPVDGPELFRTGDAIIVVIQPDGDLHRIVCAATMSGLHERGDNWKRGRAIRGGLLSAGFAYLGVQGLTPRVGIGDFVMFGLAAMFGVRTYRAVTHEEVDRKAFEDDVHAAIADLCDRIARGDEYG